MVVVVDQPGLPAVRTRHPAEHVVEGPVLHQYDDDVVDPAGLGRGQGLAHGRPSRSDGSGAEQQLAARQRHAGATSRPEPGDGSCNAIGSRCAEGVTASRRPRGAPVPSTFLRRAVTTAALAGLGLSGAGIAAAATPTHTSLSIRSVKAAINPGGHDTIAGVLLAAGHPLAGAAVVLRAQPAGASSFHDQAPPTRPAARARSRSSSARRARRRTSWCSAATRTTPAAAAASSP